jgi:hypothetical protein
VSRTHQLKTWPEPFVAVIDGKKRHEIRVDDRGFAVGDVLHLREYDPSPAGSTLLHRGYSGRECWARVTYLTPGGQWGLPSNVCVMSINVMQKAQS